MVLHLYKLESPSHMDVLCQVWLNWPSGSREEEFLISSKYFRYFDLYFHGKGWTLHLNKIESLSPKDALCQVWLNWPRGSGDNFLKISSRYFCDIVIISSLKRAWPFIYTNLNPLHPRILCTKFAWNWPSASGEEDENVKILRNQPRRQWRRTTDKFWSEKLTGELKTTHCVERDEGKVRHAERRVRFNQYTLNLRTFLKEYSCLKFWAWLR